MNKYGTYPIGNPKFIYKPPNPRDISPYFGIAKCTILLPSYLFHPVLPYRCGQKLVFPLCRTCAEANIDKPLHDKAWVCDHTPQQRQLTDTWCTPEIQKAIDQGYTLQCLHEVWHFERKQTGLFRDYVNTWHKIKDEASGFPAHCTTPEQQHQHVQDYCVQDNMKEPNSIRPTSKSTRGDVLGQIRSTPRQDPRGGIHQSSIFARLLSQLSHYKVHQDMIEVAPNLNIFIACFTTCHARLKLYEELQRLDQRVVYFDIDSIIFTQAPGQ